MRSIADMLRPPAAALLILSGAAATSLAGQAPGKPTTNEQAVIAVHDRFQAAVLASDTAVLAELLAPDYLFVTATGEVVTRGDVVRIYAAKELAHTTYRADSLRVRMLGADAAVLTALLVRQSRYVAGPRSGTEVSGQFRSTRVYVRRRGRWQVVSTHELAPDVHSFSRTLRRDLLEDRLRVRRAVGSPR